MNKIGQKIETRGRKKSVEQTPEIRYSNISYNLAYKLKTKKITRREYFIGKANAKAEMYETLEQQIQSEHVNKEDINK